MALLTLLICVVPRSKKQSCSYDRSGRLTVHVRAVPERGAANEELLEYLATQLDIPKLYVSLLAGATSRMKRVAINTTMTLEEFHRKLGLEEIFQTTILNK